MKKLLFLLIPLSVFSQNGPAGVGDVKGNSSLVIWLDANSEVQDSNSHVGLWLDKSGYKNHGHIDAGLGPVLKLDAINGNKVLQFNANRHEYLIVSSDTTIKSNQLSLYVVGKITKDSGPWSGFVLKQSGKSWNDGYGICMYDDLNKFIGFTSNFERYGLKAPLELNKYSILSLHHDSDSLKFFSNGRCHGTIDHIGEISQNEDVFWIGWTGEFLDGEIAEVIMYNNANSLIDKRFLHNYLSSKYNIQIDDDIYIYDDPLHGNFNCDLNGIGLSEDGSSKLSDFSDKMIYINNPSDLDVNEYMLWASNGVDLSKVNKIDVPDNVSLRMDRVWRVSETNLQGKIVDVGEVDLQFDISKINSNPLDLVLLIDLNDDGLFSNDIPIKATSIIDGRTISFKSVTGLKNGSRFTIGSSSTKPSNLKPFLNSFELMFDNGAVDVHCEIIANDLIKNILIQKTDESKVDNIIYSLEIDGSPGKKLVFSFKDNQPSEFNTVYSLLGLIENGDTIKLESIGLDFAFENSKYNNKIIAERRKKDLEAFEIEILYTIIFALSLITILLLILIYFKNRSVKLEKHKNELLYQIDQLKRKAAANSLSESETRMEMELDRQKLEEAIDTKIGESAWRILNLILKDPTISNKQIAEEVSLSVEGVSSSLRKMYTVFNITTPSNKKIALLMEVIKISSKD